jgi:DNA-binding transcriptional regulator YdaS (Cro superfamily)
MTYDQLIAHFGSQHKAAIRLGLTQPSVAAWRKADKIPPLRQLQYQKATRGKLKADPV